MFRKKNSYFILSPTKPQTLKNNCEGAIYIEYIY